MRIRLAIIVIFASLFVSFSARAEECSHEYIDNCDTDCDLCGNERTPPHTPSVNMGWCDGGDYHYVPCVECAERLFVTPHDEDVDSFTKDGHGSTCSVCNATVTLTAHTFTLSKGNSNGHVYSCAECDYSETEEHALITESNSEGHLFSCECGYKTSLKSHSYAIPCASECAECGYGRIAPHEYNDPIINESGHFLECALCGYSPDTEEHALEYTYTSLGHFSVCSVCAYDFGFEEHSTTDGTCPCGYREEYFPSTDFGKNYKILLWVLVGAISTVLVFVAALKRRRIAVFFGRLKKRFFSAK